MSVYDWPTGGGELVDDARGRRAFLAPIRRDFDPDGASRAGRTPAAAPRPGDRSRRRAAGHGLAAPASGRDQLWIPLGPATIIGGQAAGSPRVAGRVNAFAVSADGQRVYAGAANGGVWYSADAGGRWRSLGGLAPTTVGEITRPATRNAIGAVALRPGGTEATEEVYVGTGEPYHFAQRWVAGQPGRSLGGIGILTATGPAGSASTNPWTREAPNLVGEAVSRFALQPGGTGVVAATTIGLFRRPSPLPADANWERVGLGAHDLTDEVTDALWTPAAGARPERLWIWVRSGDHAGLWVQDGGAGAFRQVATPGSEPQRGVLAASDPAGQVWLYHDHQHGGPYLFRVSSVDANLPVATPVQGVPDILRTQGGYDIAIAVDPARPDRVYLAGSWFPLTAPDTTDLVRGSYDGAVVWADVAVDGAGTLTYGQPAPYTVVGIGMHADVHDLEFAAPGGRLWASCDGGMYRSDTPTAQVGFVPCNTGLSVAQANFTFSHPSCEGFLVAGLQDNGVIERLSSTVWRAVALGDGGGVVLDPVQPDRWLQQYVRGSWSASDGSIVHGSPLVRVPPPPPPGATPVQLSDAENKASAFYSAAAAIGFSRPGVLPPLDPRARQVVLGTTRLWYTDDFGQTWRTLPSGSDPLAGGVANVAQDVVGDQILACRWQDPHTVWVLGPDTVLRYARTPGTEALGNPGTWAPFEVVTRRRTTGKKDRKSTTGPMRSAGMWTDLAVNLETPVRGKGAVYVGTTGSPDNAEVDTLWWYDGTATWHPTRLRAAVPAPVTAIACDAAHPEEVWVGTTVGVWRGTRTIVGANPPTWTWETRVNGLPEAAVEDLSIFTDGPLRVLRAAIASRGLWELRLDVADVTDLTFLRAHGDDLRYRARSSERARDNVATRSWHGSPDVRPRLASARVPRPSTLPWSRNSHGDAEVLRRFQAAVRSMSGDARVRATGTWSNHFNEVLRSLGAPVVPWVAPAPPPVVPAPPAGTNIGIDQTFWDHYMVTPHDSVDPWVSGLPTEEDLHELTPRLSEGTLAATSCTLLPRLCKVDVVVHHRGLDPRPGGDVRVTLLRWVDDRAAPHRARPNDSTTWVPDPVSWTAPVNGLLNAVTGPLPATPATFPHGWRLVESGASRVRTLTGQTLDCTRSGVITFDLDLRGLARNTVVLLVAVIRAGDGTAANDVALTPAALRDLTLTSPGVAVRSIRIGP